MSKDGVTPTYADVKEMMKLIKQRWEKQARRETGGKRRAAPAGQGKSGGKTKGKGETPTVLSGASPTLPRTDADWLNLSTPIYKNPLYLSTIIVCINAIERMNEVLQLAKKYQTGCKELETGYGIEFFQSGPHAQLLGMETRVSWITMRTASL